MILCLSNLLFIVNILIVNKFSVCSSSLPSLLFALVELYITHTVFLIGTSGLFPSRKHLHLNNWLVAQDTLAKWSEQLCKCPWLVKIPPYDTLLRCWSVNWSLLVARNWIYRRNRLFIYSFVGHDIFSVRSGGYVKFCICVLIFCLHSN